LQQIQLLAHWDNHGLATPCLFGLVELRVEVCALSALWVEVCALSALRVGWDGVLARFWFWSAASLQTGMVRQAKSAERPFLV
jgi:hypothetical protein